MHTYIHTYMHTYIHTFIHSYIYTFIHTNINTLIRLFIHYIHTYIHTLITSIHTYIQSYIHTYTHYIHCIHTYIHTYIHIRICIYDPNASKWVRLGIMGIPYGGLPPRRAVLQDNLKRAPWSNFFLPCWPCWPCWCSMLNIFKHGPCRWKITFIELIWSVSSCDLAKQWQWTCDLPVDSLCPVYPSAIPFPKWTMGDLRGCQRFDR